MLSKKSRESVLILRLLEDKLQAQGLNLRIVIEINMDESGTIALHDGTGGEYLDCFGTSLNTFDDAVNRVYPVLAQRFGLT